MIKNLIISALTSKLLMQYIFTEYEGIGDAVFLFVTLVIIVLVSIMAVEEKILELSGGK